MMLQVKKYKLGLRIQMKLIQIRIRILHLKIIRIRILHSKILQIRIIHFIMIYIWIRILHFEFYRSGSCISNFYRSGSCISNFYRSGTCISNFFADPNRGFQNELDPTHICFYNKSLYINNKT